MVFCTATLSAKEHCREKTCRAEQGRRHDDPNGGGEELLCQQRGVERIGEATKGPMKVERPPAGAFMQPGGANAPWRQRTLAEAGGCFRMGSGMNMQEAAQWEKFLREAKTRMTG